ncbi:MAG: FKBP-type peptidyl-prolyl cis-trans isomerase [Chitinophagales bacterium]|nr:FKBP-type peptidyl-prolyl cis-trans isomerase [Chitinophagales bacterium]
MKRLFITACSLIFAFSNIHLNAQTLQKMQKVFESASNRDSTIEKYLTDNQLFTAQVSPDGIYYVVNQLGKNGEVNAGDYVSVHYTGKLLNGQIFDSSIERGEPISFQIGIGRVIQGWEKGIPLFKSGGKGTLYIPSSLAYGERGVGGVIPPNAPLIFDVEVVDVMDQKGYEEKQNAARLKMQAEAQARFEKQVEADKAVIAKYVKDNHLQVEYLPSGLAYYKTKTTDGQQIQSGDNVEVHYTGRLLDGTKFDSSKDRNQPFVVQIGANRVIQGWEQGIPVFKVGEEGTLIIPSYLAYGERGAGGVIAPNSVLLFDIEVLSIQ